MDYRRMLVRLFCIILVCTLLPLQAFAEAAEEAALEYALAEAEATAEKENAADSGTEDTEQTKVDIPALAAETQAPEEEQMVPEDEPEASEISEENEEAADIPETEETPEITETIEATEIPEASATPEASVTPEASAAPEASEAPETKEEPEASGTPEATATPEPTETADATATPEATTTPEPTPTPVPGSGRGSFVLAAYTDERLLIAPMMVNYAVGDTVRTALEKLNGHIIAGLESNEISQIDGVDANFSRYDNEGGYDLSRPAAEIDALVLTVGAMPSAERFDLNRVMAAYLDSADARGNAAATEIYSEILEAYLTLTDAEAAAWAEKLRRAMTEEEPPSGDPDAPEQTEVGFVIRTGGEMKWFADYTREHPEASAVLAANISLSGIEWTPIGSEAQPYNGSFDGQGYRISNLFIRANGDYLALFGYAGSDARISNLTVSGSVDAGGDYAAGIIAYSAASVKNLHNRCKVSSSGRYTGGVVGTFANKTCEAVNCSNSGAVSSSNSGGSAYAGGILGGKAGKISGCSNSGAVSAYSYVGGIAGQATDVTGCENSGDIQCISQYAGGIAGKVTSVDDCENKGAVTVSGVYVEVQAHYAADYIGGIAGYTSTVENCINRGSVRAREASNTHVTSAAGVAGKAGTAENCENYGNVSVAGSYIAGVIGGNGGGTVKRCANFASVRNSSSGGEQTGGVASAGKLEECYNLGSVSGNDSVGGVAGGTSNTSLKYCYNLGSVSGNDSVGGVAGKCLTVVCCYNAAGVKASGSDNGLLAGDYSSAKDSYYLNEYDLYSKAGIGLDRNELRLCMQNAEHFRLNFDTGYHGGYPCLDFEDYAGVIPAESVSLREGDKHEYFIVCGGTPSGLPGKVHVEAGGIVFACSAEWKAPAGFDRDVPGEYVFTPEVKLPEGCRIDADTEMESIRIIVCAEEDLPLVTGVSLEEGTPDEYLTAFGKEPAGLPEYALAVVDGEVQRTAIAWTAPENLDLTDTETEFVYTLRFCEGYRLAENLVLPTVSMRVRPMMLVESLRFTETVNAESREFELHYLGSESADGVQTFRYRLDILDSTSAVYICANADENYPGAALSYSYRMLNAGGYENAGNLKCGKITNLSAFAASSRKFTAENTLTLTASVVIDGAEVTQNYVIETAVYPTLESAQVMMGDTPAYTSPEFDSEWFDYRAQVIAGVEQVELRIRPTLSADRLGGIAVSINDAVLTAGADGVYTMSRMLAEENEPIRIAVQTRRTDGEILKSEYLIRLEQLQESRLSVSLSPESTKLRITNRQTGVVYADADGTYTLVRGFEYSYAASAYGYVSASGSFTADQAEMKLEISLDAAPENESIEEDLSSGWDGFRGDETNNAVSGSSTPVSAADAVLYWANQAGLDFGADAVSSPILVDGYLVCTAKQNIFKIDTVTGQIVQVGDMIKKSAFNITPPTYAKGMIFAALSDGIVQAFNAKTLESLWVYTDPLGGQPNSPISYRNGCVYTGFWNGETDDGNWVCLSVTDENPSKTNEAKQAVWTFTQKGGFYWAGACVQDNFMIVGTDDGVTGYTAQSSNLLSLDPDTGRLIDCLSNLDADIRCTICYDRATDRYYFTSKGGYFYSVAVTEDGYFRRESVKKLDLRGGRNVEGMSTSTPVVYNGRAYVGVSGVAQFQAYSGHGIAVIDLEQWKIAYMCPTKGYPQTSGLLTNAYENTGLVYIYFFDNMTPGSLRVIRDCPGQTQLLSIYDGSPISEAEVLFTPRGAQRQYVLCSPIVDEYGTFYFKNDSGYMMALGSRIISLEVTQLPDKLIYEEGEIFDGSGLKVVQHLANGAVRDVSENVSWSEEPLTVQDTDITIYFDYVCYNNESEVIDRPQTSVNLTVLSSGDMEDVQFVINGIGNLGEISIESGAAIAQLRAAYDALSVSLQELVVNYALLTRAEEEYARIEAAERELAEKVVRLIDSIGEVNLESADTIRSAFEGYNALTAYGRALVNNYELLLEKQAQYNALTASVDAEAHAIMEEIAGLGEITLESGAQLYSLMERYEKLSADSRHLVTNASLLEEAIRVYEELIASAGEMARQVIELIEIIGEVTLEKEAAILRAREAYDALDEASRERVTNYDKLLAAEAELERLKLLLGSFGEVTAQLDGLTAQIYAIAEDESKVNAQNAAELAPLVHQISQLIGAQLPENQTLFASYAKIADVYRIAIGKCVHDDAATGVSVQGLEWYQKLKVETLSSAGDGDYSRFKKLIDPMRVIKLYRITIIDLIRGTQDENHGSLQLKWTIPVPRYNESSYSAIGVIHVGGSASAQYLESSYANHNRSLKFATKGDGLIGVGGTKAQMTAGGSVSGSDSVLDDVEGSGSVFDELNQSGGSSGNSSGGYSSYGSAASYSSAQTAVLNQYGSIGEEAWEYRDVIIIPALLAQFSDEQVSLYSDMSRAVEQGMNRFFGYGVSIEEFKAVYECYRLCNPLSALAEMEFVPDEGMVEVDYLLSEEAHLEAIENWKVRIAEIVNYCVIQGDAELSAARLYQYLAQTLFIPSAEWIPAEDDPMAAFWPSAYGAMMSNCTSVNDAAKVYAYLLMQTGLECMLVQEAPAAVVPEEEAPEKAESTEAEETVPHIWTVLWQGELYTHADLEMDLYREDIPDAPLNALGHFGMGDQRRAESVNGQNGYEMIVPAAMLPDENADEDQQTATADILLVPLCDEALSGYAPAEENKNENEEVTE